MKQHFQLEEFHRDLSDEVLLADLLRVQSEYPEKKISSRLYDQLGKYSWSTIAARFGSWNRALERAGISLSQKAKYSESELFENIYLMWSSLGRQPRTREMALSPSTISVDPYVRGYGSWQKALRAFVAWTSIKEEFELPQGSSEQLIKQGPRDPSTRLRFKILQRDRFTCVGCGKSPATDIGTVLHVDHIIAWSKGGQTIESNLRTLCLPCNLGKSNAL